MKKNQFILDPLWITKGTYFDAEYFNYILLDASMKYRAELDEDNIDRFYEVLFHILNLNNLAVDGNIFTAKLKEIFNNPRVTQIREGLKKIYEIPQETAEIFKNANFVFLNVLLDYMRVEMDVLDDVKLFYMNDKIHREPNIFILTSRLGHSKYKIWQLNEDRNHNFGHSFRKIKSIELQKVEGKSLKDQVEQLDDPRLSQISGKKNLIFAVIDGKTEEKKVAQCVKDLILINKGISKNLSFEPLMVPELYQHLWIEKIMPFTLTQWVGAKP